jgi:hypothetical protein
MTSERIVRTPPERIVYYPGHIVAAPILAAELSTPVSVARGTAPFVVTGHAEPYRLAVRGYGGARDSSILDLIGRVDRYPASRRG